MARARCFQVEAEWLQPESSIALYHIEERRFGHEVESVSGVMRHIIAA
jgi:hypothetical protein